MDKILLAVAVAMTIGLCACSREGSLYLKRQVGSTVSVQFRRDTLGAGAALPVSPTTGSINGADVSLFGTLERVERTAIVISEGGHSYWIPREVILLVEGGK